MAVPEIKPLVMYMYILCINIQQIYIFSKAFGGLRKWQVT